MRVARLRDDKGRDIHVWVDDGFDEHAGDMVIKILQGIMKAEEYMGKDAVAYTFSDTKYVERK